MEFMGNEKLRTVFEITPQARIVANKSLFGKPESEDRDGKDFPASCFLFVFFVPLLASAYAPLRAEHATLAHPRRLFAVRIRALPAGAASQQLSRSTWFAPLGRGSNRANHQSRGGDAGEVTRCPMANSARRKVTTDCMVAPGRDMRRIQLPSPSWWLGLSCLHEWRWRFGPHHCHSIWSTGCSDSWITCPISSQTKHLPYPQRWNSIPQATFRELQNSNCQESYLRETESQCLSLHFEQLDVPKT